MSLVFGHLYSIPCSVFHRLGHSALGEAGFIACTMAQQITQTCTIIGFSPPAAVTIISAAYGVL